MRTTQSVQNVEPLWKRFLAATNRSTTSGSNSKRVKSNELISGLRTSRRSQKIVSALQSRNSKRRFVFRPASQVVLSPSVKAPRPVLHGKSQGDKITPLYILMYSLISPNESIESNPSEPVATKHIVSFAVTFKEKT